MKNKRFLAVLTAMTLMMGLTACGGSRTDSSTADNNSAADSTDAAAEESQPPVASGESFVIKVGYGTNPGHPIDLGSIEFEKIVEEKATELGYNVDVQLFPSAQLGSEKEMIEQLQMGTLDMCPTTTGPLGMFQSEYLVFDLPYLFLNYD